MDVIWFRFRSELRMSWRSLAALALLVGIGGAIVLGATAAARRTGSAYPRFIEESRAHDVLVSPFGTVLAGYAEEVAGLPEVADHALVAGFNVEVVDPPPPEEGASPAGGLVAVDERAFRELDRPNVIAGRLPDPQRADEIAVNRALARTLGLEPGDPITLALAFGIDGEDVPADPITFTVAGVVVNTGEVIPLTRFDESPGIMFTPAAFERYRDAGDVVFDGMLIRLEPGADPVVFERQIREIARRHPATGGDVFFADDRGRDGLVERALRPQVIALVAFAAVAGLTVLLVIGQVLGRQALLDADEYPTLRALGVRPGQIMTGAMLRALLVGSVGAALAVLGAWMSSLATPVGPARLAETDRGLSFDATALGLGALGVIVIVLTAVAPRALRIVRGPEPAGRSKPSAIVAHAARLGATASGATGMRFALDGGRGRGAVPVRSTVAGALTALAAVAATFTFGSSLDVLVSTPRLYGQDWDIVFDVGFGAVPPELLDVFETEPAIEQITAGTYGSAVIDGSHVPAVGLEQIRGSVYPTLLEGREARTAEEVVLGSSTLALLGKRVGDEVEVQIFDVTRRMRVVGRAVFPQLGQGSFTPTGLGRGAALTPEVLGGLDLGGDEYAFTLMRFRPGADVDTVVARIARRCEAITNDTTDVCELVHRLTPPDIANYARIRGMPLVLAAVLGVLAAATLAHALVTSVRRRRRDLAILRTLGFVRQQVRSSVVWQAGTLAVIAVAVGLPIGVVIGRRVWLAFASELGVAPIAIVPGSILVAVAVGALVLARVVAALPARAAAGTRPALVLRAE